MKQKFIFSLLICSILLTAQDQRQKTQPEHYSYPLENYYQPLHVRVNIVLLERADGSGNFNLKNKEERDLLNDYLDNINKSFTTLVKPPVGDMSKCGNVTEFLPDTKIRLDFNIMEVRNSYYWNYLNSGSIPEKKQFAGFSPTQGWYIKPLDDSISALKIPRAINAYFTTNGDRFDDLYKKKGEGYDLAGNNAGEFPDQVKLSRSSQVHIPNVYLSYLMQRYQSPKNYNTTWEKTKGWWLGGGGAAHEFGHDFGLSHSSEYYRANECTYSLMSQKHTHQRNWLPPNEIRRMHWNLTRTNLMQFVTPESAYGAVWKLIQDTEWRKPRRFYHNFELAPGVTLTIHNKVILPPQSYVKLNKNSKIIFKEKGELVDAYGKPYKNFEKHRTAKIIHE